MRGLAARARSLPGAPRSRVPAPVQGRPPPPLPKLLPPVISSAVPKVADALALNTRSFSVLAPLVKLTVPAVPPSVRLDVAEPLKVPEPLMAPFTTNVLPFRSTIELLPVSTRLLMVVEAACNCGIKLADEGTVTLVVDVGVVLASQLPVVLHSTEIPPIQDAVLAGMNSSAPISGAVKFLVAPSMSVVMPLIVVPRLFKVPLLEIGRASCRERVSSPV